MSGLPDRVPALQLRVWEALADLHRIAPSDPGYVDAARPALAATAALIDYEDQLPALLAAKRSRARVLAIRRAGACTVAAAGLPVLAMVPGWISAGWLVLLGPLLCGGFWMVRRAMTELENVEEDLGFVIGQMRADVEDLILSVNQLPARLDAADQRGESVRRLALQLEARTVEAEETVRGVSSLLQRIDARLGWLERSARAQHPPGSEAQLDERDPRTAQLIELVGAAAAARSDILSEQARSGLEAAVEAHADAVRGRALHLHAALEAGRVLAGTAPGDPAHVAAAAAFRASESALESTRARVRDLVTSAIRAAERLADDEQRLAARRGVIEDGERAAEQLRDRLCARITAAVAEGAALPTWFCAALGPAPPAGDALRWTETAAAVVLYRITYRVTDPERALGSEPEDDDPGRRAEHRRLSRRLLDLGAQLSSV